MTLFLFALRRQWVSAWIPYPVGPLEFHPQAKLPTPSVRTAPTCTAHTERCKAVSASSNGVCLVFISLYLYEGPSPASNLESSQARFLGTSTNSLVGIAKRQFTHICLGVLPTPLSNVWSRSGLLRPWESRRSFELDGPGNSLFCS